MKFKTKIGITLGSLFFLPILGLYISQSYIASYFLHKSFDSNKTPIKTDDFSASLLSGDISIDNFLEVKAESTLIKSVKIKSTPFSFLSDNIELQEVSLSGGVVKSSSFIFLKRDGENQRKISIDRLKINDLTVFLPHKVEPIKLFIEEMSYQLKDAKKFNYTHLQRISFKGLFRETSFEINYPKPINQHQNKIVIKDLPITNYRKLLPVIYGLIKNRKVNADLTLSQIDENKVNVQVIIDLSIIEPIDKAKVNIFKKYPYQVLTAYLKNNLKKELEVNFVLPKTLFAENPKHLKMAILRLLPKLILLQVF